MTYQNIADWAVENFEAYQYGSAREFIDAVKTRFKDDGVDFPDKAGENLRDAYLDEMNKYYNEGGDLNQQELADLGPQEAGHETYADIQADYHSRFSEFFDQQNIMPQLFETQTPLQLEATRAVDYIPTAIQETGGNVINIPPELTEAKSQRGWRRGILDVGRNLWKLLGG